MELQVAHALYRNGRLIFADPQLRPQDGTKVLVTYLIESRGQVAPEIDPIEALRGRGKGEKLVEKLLRSRQEDREHDEQNLNYLRA